MTKLIRKFMLGAATVALAAAAAAPASAQGKPEIKATHGSWSVQCAAEGKCLMSQVYKNEEGRPVLVMEVAKLAQPQQTDGGEVIAHARVLTPLNVLLTRHLSMKIDGGEAKVAPFQLCTPIGCEAVVAVRQSLIEEFKKGSKIEFLTEVPSAEGPKVKSVEVSLSGFSAAYDEL